MLFHEKLYKLRKEKNLSQEALAEKLGTTRQAVSKWENEQGFPETEKLLTIANLFMVSVDYLLKDTNEEVVNEGKGYYVSKEMAEGYFANQKRWLKCFVLGIAILILSINLYLKFEQGGANPTVFIGMLVAGGFLALRGILLSDETYKVLGNEPLIFDGNYLKELRIAAEKSHRRYVPVFVGSFVIFMVSISVLTFDAGILAKDFSLGIPAYIQITIMILALSAASLFYTGTMEESYGLLAKNEEHVQGFWFRFTRKMKQKIDGGLR